MTSNYPPGVTGYEIQITGEDDAYDNEARYVGAPRYLSERHHTDCDHYQSWLASQSPYPYERGGVYPCNLDCANQDDGSDDYHEVEA